VRRHMTSFSLMVCGVIALALSMAVAPTAIPASAMPALQPSPRPTLVPTPEYVPDNDDDDAPALFGRVTGTVIDSRTGAPAADKLVLVNDSLVLSDDSGNYDHWLAAGSYSVGLQLRSGEGVAAQGMLPVEVQSDGTTVQHLFFSSPAPIMVDVAPKAAEPTPSAAPSVEAPVALPATTTNAAPVSLPETAATSAAVPGPLVLVGAVMLALGALLQVRPRRRRLGPDELLRELLNREL